MFTRISFCSMEFENGYNIDCPTSLIFFFFRKVGLHFGGLKLIRYINNLFIIGRRWKVKPTPVISRLQFITWSVMCIDAYHSHLEPFFQSEKPFRHLNYLQWILRPCRFLLSKATQYIIYQVKVNFIAINIVFIERIIVKLILSGTLTVNLQRLPSKMILQFT